MDIPTRFDSAYTEQELQLVDQIATGLWMAALSVLAILTVWSTAVPTAI